MDSRYQFQKPVRILIHFAAFCMLVISPPANASFSASIQKLKECRKREGEVVANSCNPTDKCGAFAQNTSQQLNQSLNNEDGISMQANAGMQMGLQSEPCIRAVNEQCLKSSSSCSNGCQEAARQADQDYSKCVAAAPTQKATCAANRDKIKQVAQSSKSSCEEKGSSFDLLAVGALAAIAGVIAKNKKTKESSSSNPTGISCDLYNSKSGVLIGHEGKYTPPTEKLAGASDQNGKSAEIPKAINGYPLFNSECITEQQEVAICEHDIDCYCAKPETAEQLEVCGCYDSQNSKAVVSLKCATVFNSHPELKSSIAKKEEQAKEENKKSNEASGSDKTDSMNAGTEYMFNEQEQMRLANELGRGSGAPNSTPGSSKQQGEGEGSSELAKDGEASSTSNVTKIDFGFKSNGKASSELAKFLPGGQGQRQVSSVVDGDRLGINPAHGKGVFELISDAYKKHSRQMKE